MFNRIRKFSYAHWILLLLTVAGTWLLGDYVHSELVARAVERWEADAPKDENGNLKGSRGYFLKGNRTLVVLVHGFNDTPKTFDLMAPALHDHGFSVQTIRLPGFGEPLNKMQAVTWNDWVTRTNQIIQSRIQLEQNAESPAFDKVVLIGHSLGGAIAINDIAGQSFIDGAVLLAPVLDVANHRSPLFPTRFWQRVGDYLLPSTDVYYSPYDRNDCRDVDHRNPEYKPPFTTRNIVQQTFALIDANQELAEKITIPVFMALSRDDQVTDWAAAEKFFERLASASKQLRFYDSSGHALTVDHDWKRINGDMINFIQDEIPGKDRSIHE